MYYTNEKQKHDIKFVALYLRKSRGDEETALENHKLILTELAKKNNWKYVMYTEIGSADSISLRPKMQQLLKEVKEGVYDAVVCVDYDRLSRGDLGDQDRVKKAFQKSSTYIVTPQKIYDLNDELDDSYSDFQGLIARQEYKMIVKRLQRGKKIGARQGHWVNGTPPFPYVYERYKDKYNEKGLVVNDEYKIIYDYMVKRVLEGASCNEVAWELNKQNIPSPKGKLWHGQRIYSILTNEVCLGKIVSNKSYGNGKKNKKEGTPSFTRLPKNQWVIVENCHEPIISQEDFDTIKNLLERRRLFPVAARAGKHDLSGLIKCALCGCSMQIQLKSNGKHQIKRCWHKDEYGNQCINRGGQVISTEKIWQAILEYRDELQKAIEENLDDNTEGYTIIEEQLNQKYKLLDKYKSALDKATDAYDLGDYTREEFLQRKNKWLAEIEKVENEIYELDKKLNTKQDATRQELLNNINIFIEKFPTLTTTKEKNEALKLIIENITWERVGNKKAIYKINFIKGVNSIDEVGTINIVEEEKMKEAELNSVVSVANTCATFINDTINSLSKIRLPKFKEIGYYPISSILFF